MIKIKKFAFQKASMVSIAFVCTAITIQALSGCAFTPKPVEAQEILTKAFSSRGAKLEAGQYVLSESELYRIQSEEPSDPFHKKGMRPDLTQIKFWQSGDSQDTYRLQHLNPETGNVLMDVTQVISNGQVFRHTRDAVSAVEFDVAIPKVDRNSDSTKINTLELDRQKALIKSLGQNAVLSKHQSDVTGQPEFHIASSQPFSPDQLPPNVNTFESLKQQPKELRRTFNIDEQTFEILGQSVVALMPDGSEYVIESKKLVSRTVGNLSELPNNWLTAKNSDQTAGTLGFDIRNEVVTGRAYEQVQNLPQGRVLSIISGPKFSLTQGLQSAAPVWNRSSEVTLTIAGSQQQAWLCEGGVIGSDPVRRLLIFVSGDKLFYITGQSFSTNDEFTKASVAELERAK